MATYEDGYRQALLDMRTAVGTLVNEPDIPNDGKVELLGVVSLIALAVVWGTWVVVSPQQAAQTSSGPWTNRVGLALAVAWPIQCGIGLVVIG